MTTHIKIPESLPWRQYTAADGQTVFDYPFPVFDSSDLAVYINGTLATEGVDYIVQGAGGGLTGDQGGTIALTSGSTAGDIVTLFSAIAIARTTDYTENGDLPAASVNLDFDRVVRMLQQLEARLDRKLGVPLYEQAAGLTFPAAGERALKTLMFDAAGNPSVGEAVPISPATGYAVSDEETAASIPVALDFFVWGHIKRYGPDDMVAFLNSFRADAGRVRIPKGAYELDNTSEILIAESNLTIELDPNAELILENAGMGIVLTGQNLNWRGGKIRGEGSVITSPGERTAALLLVDGTAHTSPANVDVAGLELVNPNQSGVGVLNAVGVNIERLRAVDESGSTSNQRFGVYMNNVADCSLTRSRIKGFGDGIVGGGASPGNGYDSYDGISSNELRGVLVAQNWIHGSADHNVYFSDNVGQVSVVNNRLIGAANNPIKLQGAHNLIAHNFCMGDLGITMRNGRRSRIVHNDVIVTGTGPNHYGFNDQGTVYDWDVDLLEISHNLFWSTNPAGAWHAIQAYGELIDADNQRTVKGLTIADNRIRGHFCKLGGTAPAAINVRTDSASSPQPMEALSLHDNDIDLEAGHDNAGWGVRVRVGAKRLNVHHNIVKGVTTGGMDLVGGDTGFVDHNTFEASPDSTQNPIGLQVDGTSTNLTIGPNKFAGFTTNENINASAGVTRVRDFVEYTGEVTWDIPLLGAGVGDSQTMTINGVEVGDPKPELSIDGSLAGLMIDASINANGQAVISVFNPTGAPVNPGELTITGTVRKAA